jgi:hypothetical protein
MRLRATDQCMIAVGHFQRAGGIANVSGQDRRDTGVGTVSNYLHAHLRAGCILDVASDFVDHGAPPGLPPGPGGYGAVLRWLVQVGALPAPTLPVGLISADDA